MKKTFYSLTYGLSIMFCMGLVGLTSCSKDDDDPKPEPAKPVLSFKTSQVTVNEADGEVDIELVLDQPAPSQISVDLFLFSLSQSLDEYDLGVEDTEITIEKGATSGKLTIQLYSDFEWEDTEVLGIAIDDVSGDEIEYSTTAQMAVIIEQEDGMIAVLEWEGPNDETGKFADMDMFIYAGPDAENLNTLVGLSYFNDVWPYELVFVPKTFDATFGLALTYVYGNADPLDFTVSYFEYTDGQLFGEESVFSNEGSYTLANKNNWRPRDKNPNTWVPSELVVQTISVEGGEYDEPSAIIVPNTSSRMATRKVSSWNRPFLSNPFRGSAQQKLYDRLKQR